MKNRKMIICKGNAFIPERFWDWTVCFLTEYTEELKSQGWINRNNQRYLNEEQLAFLQS